MSIKVDCTILNKLYTNLDSYRTNDNYDRYHAIGKYDLCYYDWVPIYGQNSTLCMNCTGI